MHIGERAFTLVELAIVMVIVGLVIGGILVGADMIRATTLRSTITDIERINAAASTYRNRYNALPGDHRTATTLWGALPGCPNVTFEVVGSNTQTCDGDGNNRIVSGGLWDAMEGLSFWKHLANAGLISGQYTGTGIMGVMTQFSCGPWPHNTPRVKAENTCISVVASRGWAFENIMYPRRTAQVFLIGGETNNTYNITPTFSTADSYYIDTKVDDGRPGTGIVASSMGDTVWNGSDPDCATDNTTSASYDTSLDGNQCVLVFNTQF